MKPLCLLILFLILSANVGTHGQSFIVKKISEKIESTKIFKPAIKFRLDRFNDEMTISTYRHTLANRKDMKINALLISECVLDVSPDSINKVHVFYFDQVDNSKYWCAVVSRKLMNRLRKKTIDKHGAINQVQLYQSQLPNPIKKYTLSSYNEITSKLPISDGILKPERTSLQKRISTLKTRGVDVGRLETLFLQIDDAVRLQEESVKPLYLYTLNALERKESNVDQPE